MFLENIIATEERTLFDKKIMLGLAGALTGFYVGKEMELGTIPHMGLIGISHFGGHSLGNFLYPSSAHEDAPHCKC